MFCKNKYSLKQLFYRVSNWLYDQDLWKIPVKKFNFNNAADLYSATLLRTGHSHRQILFHIDLEQLFCRRSPSRCF